MLNFSPFEITRRVFRGGRISLKGMVLIPAYYLQLISTLPLAFLQFLIYGQRIRKTPVSNDPVFILGHYRCGTTLLQKLMASDKRYGFLNYYDSLFPNTNLLFGNKMQPFFQRLINTFKIKNPFFRDSLLQLSEPDEEDDYLMNKASAYSAYWGLIFPRRWREWLNGSKQFNDPDYLEGWKREYLHMLQQVTFRNKGKQLVLKNPPNTERIRVLLQMFPQAKFIFIYRNPYHLYSSIRNMWTKAILSNYSLQGISDEELDELIFDHFVYLTGQYEKNKHLIPDGNLIEISYEELKADAFGTVHKIYSRLELPDFEETAEDLILQIESEKKYRNFQYQWNAGTFRKIEERWGEYIRLWKYKTPELISDSNSPDHSKS